MGLAMEQKKKEKEVPLQWESVKEIAEVVLERGAGNLGSASSKDELKKVFKGEDGDNGLSVSIARFRSLLGSAGDCLTEEELDKILESAKKNGLIADGILSF